MYYSFNEIYEPELVKMLWKIGLKDIDIIYKIININKKNKISNRNYLENKSRKFYLELDSVGEYNNNVNIDDSFWTDYRLWYNLHKELIIWHKFLYKNNKNMSNNISNNI
tara:strand:+ start:230 stop:559 length:330 start_codon:yes stop_codon:yes gene_type:complete